LDIIPNGYKIMVSFGRAPASLKIAPAPVPPKEQLLDRSRCLLHIVWPNGSSPASLFLRSHELNQQRCSAALLLDLCTLL
jgi:hypothetical protein